MKITILGGGSFGTALAYQLSFNSKNEISLLVKNQKQATEINTQHTNTGYFPKRTLPHNIKSTTDYKTLEQSTVLFIAIPTKNIVSVIDCLKNHLNKNCLVVNMAKGLLHNGQTIVDYLAEQTNHPLIVSMKGASFSAEMINNVPTLFTVGFKNKPELNTIFKVINHTHILVDYTNDIKGVELLSAVKNIYAIALGFTDGHFNALNTRFLILTKAVEEIKIILRSLGGKAETIFLSCGIGDISLTGLNDLSRNRTLGLLIGKGFFNQDLSSGNSVVLEGTNTLKVIDEAIPTKLKERLPLFMKVKALLNHPKQDVNNIDFQQLFKRTYKTVLTYGTFDLLHFGHLELLRRVRNMGDRVIVGLSTDTFNEEKNKQCIMSYDKRKHLLEVLSYVDLVIPESNWNQKENDIKTYDVDVFVMGDDWKGKFDHLNEFCEVIYLPRTKGISTTQLKKLLKE